MLRRLIMALVVAIVAGPLVQIGQGAPAHATPPGLNGKIAFTSNVDGRPEVYAVNADGSGVTELTDTAGSSGASWSPDGSSIAFTDGPDGGIYIATEAGSNPRRVTDGGYYTAWSPDGSKLAFNRASAGPGVTDLYTVNVDGTGVQEVVPDAITPAWSPDGSKIAYRAPDGIHVVNADGTNTVRLTTVAGDDNPQFSPDGTKIAFTSWRSGTGQIWMMNADGSNQTALTSSSSLNVTAPSWSPDGAALAVSTGDASGNQGIAVMNADGTGLHAIVSHMATTLEPAWERILPPKPPFNGKLVFNSIGSTSPTTIYTTNPDDTEVTNVSGVDGGFEPAWSPDGTRLAFLGNNPSGLGIYVMDADGANRRLVVPSTTQPVVVGLAWSGDGSKIAYTARNAAGASADIWTVNVDGTGNTDIISVGEFPAWSPDGSKLLFNRAWAIVEANADGSNQTTLLTPSSGIVAQAPSFSPDGTKIIYGLGSSTTASNLWVMNADGSGQRQLTNLPGYNTYPRYSPDGRFVAFEQSSAGQDGPFHLAVMNADGSGVRTLAGDGGDDQFLAWQPITQPMLAGPPSQVSATAGNAWAKVSWTAPVYDGGVPITGYTVTASPGGASVTVFATQATATVPGLTNGTRYTFTVQAVNSAGPGTVSDPSNSVTPVSMFNGRIAFTRQVGSVGQIFTANADGSDARQITSDPGGSATPSWSPDGTQLAIDGGPAPQGVYVINADGSSPRRVSDNPALFISWSPDGTKLAYIRPGTAANTIDIATVNIDGTGETHLGTGVAPAWTPDSQGIVFLNNHQLWRMNADGSERTPLLPSESGSAPSVSPDGSKVVFDGADGIRVVGIDGSNSTLLYPSTTADWPRWSRDGSRIVFQTARASTTGSSLAVMNADGSNIHTITTTQGNDQFPDWQPLSQDPNGTFVPLSPARILDTRTTNSPIGQNRSIDIQATGQGGVPAAGVTAVVVNLTATQPTAASYLTAYPAGIARPAASNLNFVAGETIANLVTVKVGTGGKFSVYNLAGLTHVVADVVGWYSDGSVVPGDRYTPLSPARILDTRTTNAPLTQGQTRSVQVAGQGGVPASGVSAVVVNVTETGATANGFFTVYPSDAPSRPNASNLNFVAGETIPNLAVVKLGADGKVDLYNLAGSAHAIFDVVGYYGSGGSAYSALTPSRILDTRTNNTPLGQGETRPVQVAGQGGVPVTGATAVVVNVTETGATANGFFTVYPSDAPSRPNASNLNFVAGETIPNLVVVKLGADGKVDLYNLAGSAHAIFDVVGYFGP